MKRRVKTGRIEQVTFPLSRMDNTEDDGGGRKPALGENFAVNSVLIGDLEISSHGLSNMQ